MTEAEWLDRGDPISSIEAERGWPSPRKQRLFAVACCRRIQNLSTVDSHWHDALAVAERYADRKAKRVDLRTAHANVEGSSASKDRTYRDVLAELVSTAILWACHTSMRKYAAQAARSAACAAACAALPLNAPCVRPAYSTHAALWSTAENAEKSAQIALLRDICGDPFRPVVASIEPPTCGIIRLAQAAYTERTLPAGALEAVRLAVLADALEEAGCTNADILGHLRGNGPHVPGCWVVDLLLGKQ